MFSQTKISFMSLYLAVLLFSSATGFRLFGTEVVLTKELFMTRCEKATAKPRKFPGCENLWKEFASTYGCSKLTSQCSAITSHETFISKIPPMAGRRETVFYSGNIIAEANNYAKKCKSTTIQKTLLGQIFDDTKWCCVPDSVSMCMDDTGCMTNTMNGFWQVGSKKFAQNAKGLISTILHGNSGKPAYNLDSYFAKYEVPNLTKKARKMVVHLWYDNNSNQKWTCKDEEGSNLSSLKSSLKQKSVKYECKEDMECPLSKWGLALSIVSGCVVFLVAVCVLCYCCCCRD